MKLFIYNAFIRLYYLLIKLVAPFHDKAGFFVSGRKNLLRRVRFEIRKGDRIIWFHCASLGEFEQARPIIEDLKNSHAGVKILLTFFSPSGYELRKNYAKADYVYYLPMDSKRNAQQWLDIVNPEAIFFIKYEFWYHYATAARQRDIPLFSVSSIFRKNQPFFKSYGDLHRKILAQFTHFFVQDKNSAQLLEKIGITNVTVSGDTRFDRVNTIRQQTNQYPVIEAFKEGKRIFVVGSCWPEDMEVLSAFINQNEEDIKYIIAPHEVYEMSVKRIEKQIDRRCIRFSDATPENAKDYSVLIIDNMGMLSSIYQYGEYAFIGGAYGKGLHNILEAATFGLPVFLETEITGSFGRPPIWYSLGAAFAYPITTISSKSTPR